MSLSSPHSDTGTKCTSAGFVVLLSAELEVVLAKLLAQTFLLYDFGSEDDKRNPECIADTDFASQVLVSLVLVLHFLRKSPVLNEKGRKSKGRRQRGRQGATIEPPAVLLQHV